MSAAVSELVAGRELDALIAEKVFGLVRCQGDFHDADFPSTYCFAPADSPTKGGEVPSYSTEIGAAWQVVEKLVRDGWKLQIDIRDGLTGVNTLSWNGEDCEDYRFGAGHSGPSALHEIPHCICRAALAAVAVQP